MVRRLLSMTEQRSVASVSKSDRLGDEAARLNARRYGLDAKRPTSCCVVGRPTDACSSLNSWVDVGLGFPAQLAQATP